MKRRKLSAALRNSSNSFDHFRQKYARAVVKAESLLPNKKNYYSSYGDQGHARIEKCDLLDVIENKQPSLDSSLSVNK